MSNSKHKFTVEELKTRLDKFLAEQFSDLAGKVVSRGKIQADIELGAVKVNGEVTNSPKFIVRVGDKVEYKPIPEEKHGPKNIPLVTLYNNHGLLIIDKPAGLVVHPGAGFKGDSLAQALLYHFKDIHLVGEEGRSGIVHRIDKDTSGVMMVALTPDMYEHLKDAFADHLVKKEYIALVKGKIEAQHGKIDLSLGKSKKDFRKYTTKIDDMVREKPSLTEYWVLEHLTDGVDFYTLIKVKLHTGRTHQIRVHFSSLGFPLMGDSLYGGKKVMKLPLKRQFLHASRIEVQLPDKTWVEAESKLPKDLQEILNNLDKI
ncbi:MAG TPA: RluA family pseudouridine synthase [Patescibacteria group bacterium]|nr:RluA family pseudouridine synthase [Patescibacteria group bacterium]